jgi:hypothetical protein
MRRVERRRRSRFSLWLCAAGAVLPACFFFSDFDGLSGGPAPAGSDAAEDTDATCTGSQFDMCQVVPKAPAGFAQVVDAMGDDFCQVPAQIFLPKLGKFHTCGTDANFIDSANAEVVLRMAWSDAALSVFAHVQKDPSIPIVSDTPLYKGDALELFFANTATRTGDLAADNALHVIIAPPPEDGGPGGANIPDGEWASRRTADAYEIELRIPWSEFGGPAPNSGAKVVVDLGVDIVGPQGERYQSFVHYEQSDGATLYCKDNSLPVPSDGTLTWCESALQ